MNSEGREGEREVFQYLVDEGYRILETNYRWSRREVDIIASKAGVVAFVEVKKRNGSRFGTGLESVTETKKRRILSVARHYIHTRGMYGRNIRFDVVSIDDGEMRHVENAFQMQV
jgi:putative endonuclease